MSRSVTAIPRPSVYTAAILLLCTSVSGLAAERVLQPLWELEIKQSLPQSVREDAQGRPFLYLAAKERGLLVLRQGRGRTQPPSIAAALPIDQLGDQHVMHLTQRGDLLFLALGDLFSANGSPAGLAVVSVEDPLRPSVTGLWVSPDKLHGSAIVVVDDRYAYLGAMTAGVLIFDVSDPSSPKLLSTFQPDVNFPRPNPNKVQHPNARGLALAGEQLFVAYDAGGLRVLDIRDRSQPREIGRYINPAMAAKQQAYNNLVLDGDTAYVAVDYAGLEILDVRNPQRITQRGWWNPWEAETGKNVWINSPGHTNQIELDPRKHLAYLSAGDSELLVVDVKRPDQPQLTARVGGPRNNRGTWGVAMGQDAVYLTYIQAFVPFRGTWSGLTATPR